MLIRNPILALLLLTVLAPIILYTDRLPISNRDHIDDGSTLNFGNEVGELQALSEEFLDDVKEPVGDIYSDNSSNADQVSSQSSNGSAALARKGLPLEESGEHNHRLLSTADEGVRLGRKGVIEQVRSKKNETSVKEQRNKPQMSPEVSSKVHQTAITGKPGNNTATPDAMVRHIKDQLVHAKIFLMNQSNPHFVRELLLQVRDVERTVVHAAKDSDLPKNASEKLKALEQTLAKEKPVQEDCSATEKKLNSIISTTEKQLSSQAKQAMFLSQLAAKTIPSGIHCLSLRLSIEYFSLNTTQQQHFPNQEKFEDPELFHYALFSDNVLAASVVVNSTVSNAKHPSNHVFHIITDKLNYAAMRMWFLVNPPGKATIQVQKIEEFTWLNSSYSPVLEQLLSQSMINFYFRTQNASSDGNLKFRNPKYLSMLNHLRFYLPELFPKLDKVVFLDDDIVVQKDITGLWAVDLKGKVNGAVETCGESFHRFDKYLNFSNPLISKNFDPHACGWAYGMNLFDLAEWRRQNITEVYHSWQKLNHDRLLWKLGTLPPGLITFYNRTVPLDRAWHVLGLGYNLDVKQKEIERAAVIHYNGNQKPWLEIGMPKYRGYWSKFVSYDQVYVRECNIDR